MVESWLIEDSTKDKSALYGFELPIGTWMLSVKVNNYDIWEKVKAKEVRGFSIEGYFSDKLVEMKQGKLCKNCPEDATIIAELKSILLDEVKPSAVLNGQPLFKRSQDAQLWGEMFHNQTGYTTLKLNGQTLFGAKESLEAYPWDECIADQIAEYGSKETAEKICGMIKSKYG